MQHSDFEAAVGRQSWEWLIDVAPRLGVIVEMTGDDGVPVLPVGPSRDAAAFRMMLTAGEPTMRSAIADVAGSTSRVLLGIEDIQALGCGLVTGGALLVARRMTGAESIEESRQDLQSIGNWLTVAVEASLAQTNAISVEPYRILSFQRILREATSRGSSRKVVGAFVEALSVWDDVRVRCYVAGAGGGLLLYGSPLTALPTSPDELDESIVPPHGRMVRVSSAEADRFGLVTERGDTLVLRVLVGDIAWLLIFSGRLDESEQVRLTVYSDMLRESLNDVVTNTTSRLMADVSRVLRSSSERPETAARTALDRLTAAVGGQRGALALATPNGDQAVAVGDTDLLVSGDRPWTNRLVVKSSDAGSVLTLVVEREQGRFTAFEHDVAVAGMTVVHRGMRAALERSSDGERRRRFRPVDSVFDQLAADTLAAGRQASVIVVSVDAAAARHGLLPGWVATIRAQLRAGDFAGLLSEREIAVLLCGASAHDAATVSARLKQIFKSDDTIGTPLHSGIGMSTRSPDSPFEGSIVGAARALAASPR